MGSRSSLLLKLSILGKAIPPEEDCSDFVCFFFLPPQSWDVILFSLEENFPGKLCGFPLFTFLLLEVPSSGIPETMHSKVCGSQPLKFLPVVTARPVLHECE